jgi:hypothetical protein
MARDVVALELRDAHSALTAAHARVGLAREQLAAAHELEQAERSRFRLGDSTLLLVNLREQAATDAALQELDALAEYHRAAVDLRASRPMSWRVSAAALLCLACGPVERGADASDLHLPARTDPAPPAADVDLRPAAASGATGPIADASPAIDPAEAVILEPEAGGDDDTDDDSEDDTDGDADDDGDATDDPWIVHEVAPGETLAQLALRYRVDPGKLRGWNGPRPGRQGPPRPAPAADRRAHAAAARAGPPHGPRGRHLDVDRPDSRRRSQCCARVQHQAHRSAALPRPRARRLARSEARRCGRRRRAAARAGRGDPPRWLQRRSAGRRSPGQRRPDPRERRLRSALPRIGVGDLVRGPAPRRHPAPLARGERLQAASSASAR